MERSIEGAALGFLSPSVLGLLAQCYSNEHRGALRQRRRLSPLYCQEDGVVRLHQPRIAIEWSYPEEESGFDVANISSHRNPARSHSPHDSANHGSSYRDIRSRIQSRLHRIASRRYRRCNILSISREILHQNPRSGTRFAKQARDEGHTESRMTWCKNYVARNHVWQSAHGRIYSKGTRPEEWQRFI
jgi:hypothetical protein